MTDHPDRRNAAMPDSAQPLRLLLVDDDVNYRTYVAALSRRLGFWVEAADDGAAALDRLAQGAYDIVIVDQEMPRMTGVETIRRIRDFAPARDIYAMMLTGREDVDTKLTALDAGFDDFLTKTSSEPELVAKLVAGRRLAARHRNMDAAIGDLYRLSTRDDLTGAFNRRFFISEAERMLAERTPLSVILLDLDEFKTVNDTLGHVIGDSVLRDVATSLHSNTRAEDIVARFGGDEFVLALPHLDLETVERIADRLRQAIEALEWNAPRTFRIGASVGIASSHLLPAPNLVQLVTVADRDMYKKQMAPQAPGRPRRALRISNQNERSGRALLLTDPDDQVARRGAALAAPALGSGLRSPAPALSACSGVTSSFLRSTSHLSRTLSGSGLRCSVDLARPGASVWSVWRGLCGVRSLFFRPARKPKA